MIEDIFRFLDEEDFGFIDYEVFSVFMNNINDPISNQELMALIRRFDENDNGRITFEDFNNQLLLPMSSSKFMKGMKNKTEKQNKSLKNNKTKKIRINWRRIDRIGRNWRIDKMDRIE